MPSFEISGGWDVTSKDPIDFRLVLSKEEMKNANEAVLPKKKSYYFAFCKDDQCWYYYNAAHSVDPETGKYRKMTSGGANPSAESGPVADRPAAADGKPGDKWYDPETGKTYIIATDSEGNQSWAEVTPEAGEMMYDSTNNVIMYFDGTEWKPIGGGIESQHSVDPTSTGTPGEIIYDETAGEYKTFEPAKSGDASGVWVSMAKVLEVTESAYAALNSGGGDAWSVNHPDVIIFVKDN